MNISAMSKREKIEAIEILEEKQRRIDADQLGIMYRSMYGWQKRFNAATAINTSCLLLAANRVGKTRTGLIIDAHHLTGEYPEDWEGHIFTHAPFIWIMGYSMEKTRDLLQQPLFGRIEGGEFLGGMIAKDKIIGYFSAAGTSGAVREVRVKHKSGGVSICQFWSYSQGEHSLMGNNVDWYHIDEEPKDHTIFPQVLTRTATGDRGKGGRGILTFTPENGRTELVISFMDDPGKNQYMQVATWDDAKHLTEETKESLLGMYPAYQRDMRSKGLPLMGSGLIFEVDENEIKCEPFQPPQHWFVINGMDFGWDHPQAHIQLVWDRDADAYYVTNAWKASKKQPYEAWHCVKYWAEDIPTAWPHDGLQSEKSSGEEQKAAYVKEGWLMLNDCAQWEDGGNGVWVGIAQLNDAMKTGRFKVFSNLFEVFEEIRQYHTVTDDKGKSTVVKIKDDLISAIRYAYMMRRYAIRIMDINSVYNTQTISRTGRDTTTGY